MATRIDMGAGMGDSVAQKAYVTGVGWCWMNDGDIIEVIESEDDMSHTDTQCYELVDKNINI